MPLVPLDNATESAWRELASEVEAAPFLHPGWVKAWYDAFGRGRLELFTRHEGGALAAALPVAISRFAARSPTNWHTPEFGVVARSADARDALLDEVMTTGPSLVDLSFLEPATMRAARDAAGAAGRSMITWTQQESPYLPIVSDWHGYLETRDRRWLRKLGRRRERLEDAGRVGIELHEGTADLDRLLEEGFRVEGSGWKGERGTSVLSSPSTRQFYWSVARWAAERGWLRLAFLRLDGRVAAFNFGLEANRRYYSIKSGMDESFRQLAPGMLLRYEMIKRSFDTGLQSYEMLGGDEPWKRDWTDDKRPRLRAMSFDRSLAGRTGWLMAARARPAAKALARAAASIRHRFAAARG